MLTRARSSERRYIPASSDVSVPTSKLGSVDFGKLSNICSSSPGASLDAQPAHFTVAVKRIFWLVIVKDCIVNRSLYEGFYFNSIINGYISNQL